MDADTADGYQLANLNRGLNVQFVRGIFEDIQNDLVIIRALRRSCQAECERWLEVGQHFLVCIRCGVMGLIYDKIIKVIVFEAVQMQRHALNVAADHMGMWLFDALHVSANRGARPQFSESLSGLVDQLLSVSEEQGPAATALGVHDGGHCFAGAGCVIQKSNRLIVVSHGLQRF